MVSDNKPIDQWLKPIEDNHFSYQTNGIGRPRDLELIPFYNMYDQRHVVYWDNFTQKEWEEKEEAYQVELKRVAEIEKRTVDILRL